MIAHRSAPARRLDDQRAAITIWARSRALPQRHALRARVVLLAAEGVANSAIAARPHCSAPTVRLRRRRFLEAGGAGLEQNAPCRGRPRTHDELKVEVSQSTVLRIGRDHDVQPHRSRSLEYITDPHLADKVTDVVWIFLDPPDKAVVLGCDEKSPIQAFDRTQPLLPLRSGQPERRTPDYLRHGSATRFAALDIATGEATGRTCARHRHREFIFTPTSASRLNRVATWFSILHRQVTRRGVFRSVAHLKDAIQLFPDARNANQHPFIWVKTADRLLHRAKPKAISAAVP